MGLAFYIPTPPTPPVEPVWSYDAVNSQNFNGVSLGIEDSADPGNVVSAVSNNSVLIGWYEEAPSEFDTSESKVNLRNIDLTDAGSFSVQTSLVCNNHVGIAKLTGGTIAVAYTDQTGNPRLVRLATVNASTGAIVNGPITVDGDVVNSRVSVTGLNNGNLAVFWGNGNSVSTRYRIYDASLSPVIAEGVVDATTEPDMMASAVLTGGNFVVLYKKSSASSSFSVYNQAGSLITNTAFGLSNYHQAVAPTNDGGFCLLSEYNRSIYVRKCTSTGGFVTTPTIHSAPATDPGGGMPYGAWNAVSILKLDSGNIGVLGWSAGSKTLYFWEREPTTLTEVTATTSLVSTTGSMSTWRPMSLAAFGGNKYASVMQREGDLGRRVYVDVFQYS